jgi:hypothetical protein
MSATVVLRYPSSPIDAARPSSSRWRNSPVSTPAGAVVTVVTVYLSSGVALVSNGT